MDKKTYYLAMGILLQLEIAVNKAIAQLEEIKAEEVNG
jgi:hypothetical protein